MSDRAEEVIRAFCAAWEARDVARIVEAFTADGVYHNIPMQPAAGHEAIRRLVAQILKPAREVRFELKHLLVQGNIVLTERLDTFVMEARRIELPVMGTFELRAEKIAAWRDYFDLNQWLR